MSRTEPARELYGDTYIETTSTLTPFVDRSVSGLSRGSFGAAIRGIALGDGIDNQHERVQQREPEQKQQHHQIRIDVGGHREHLGDA